MSGQPDIRNLHKPIVFIHIEKTAGTAFTSYLHSNVGYDRIATPYYGGSAAAYFGKRGRHGKREKSLYYGHMSYRTCKAVCPEAYYITLLRAPLERAISQYKSWKNPANLTDEWAAIITKPELEAVKAVQQMTFQEYVMSENPYIYGHINNIMCARLARRSNSDDTPSLGSAFEALYCEFHYFGIVDAFAESMRLFSHSFSGTHPFGVPPEESNISNRYDTTLDAKGKKRLTELNEYDFKLYAAAVEILEERCRSISAE